MKAIILFITLGLLLPLSGKAQGENNICIFTYGVNHSNLGLKFDNNPPGIVNVPANYAQAPNGAAVCSTNGQLRFVVRLTPYISSAPYMNVLLPDGTPVPGSDFNAGTLDNQHMPVVIPRPDNPDQYYIFYCRDNGLQYALLDMNLNNGQGGIVVKDVILSPYASICPKIMTAIKGCDGVWLVIRSRVGNQYKSYHVTASGLDTQAVVSEVGAFQQSQYYSGYPGFLKAAHNKPLLAFCGWPGIELYDFESCSGKMKKTRVIDSTGNDPISYANSNNYYRINDVAFSPDDSKLYATENHRDGTDNSINPGKLYQFDLTQATTAAITASKTLILTNYPSLGEDISLQCLLVMQNPLGYIKCAPNGKIYVDNGSITCRYPDQIPPGYNPGAAFHVINHPNLTGVACGVEYNNIVVGDFIYPNALADFYQADATASRLQYDIISNSAHPDTIVGHDYYRVACFTNLFTLTADSPASCYYWDNGSTERIHTVSQPGKYWVRYYKDCTITTDTYNVSMVHLPLINVLHQDCPGQHLGKVAALSGSENGTLEYTWKNSDSSVIRQHTSDNGDTISGLNAGNYLLNIKTAGGCDTTLLFSITSLPAPQVEAWPADTTIHYGDSIMLQSGGALYYSWAPSGLLSADNIQSPIAHPLQPTTYTVIGRNEYDCEGKASVQVNIDYNAHELIPSAFSPNGDGLNDVFRIKGITYQTIMKFIIYNRYGQVIFSTYNNNNGWNGTQNGKPCDVGTYYYLIEVGLPDNSSKIYKGDISLIR